jgi:hypothetical protein
MMSRPRLEFDYTTQSFNCDINRHHDFIAYEIEHFDKCLTELSNYDKRSECLVVLLGCGWLFNFIGMTGSLLLCSSFIFASHELFGRPEYLKKYQDQLNKLVDIYQWCISNDEKRVGNNTIFLKLVETLVDYLCYEDLKKPFKNWNGISESFKLILLHHPLHKDLYLRDKMTPTTTFFSWFREKKEDAPIINNHGETLTRLKRSYAEFRFSLYGRHTNQNVSLIENCVQTIQHKFNIHNS